LVGESTDRASQQWNDPQAITGQLETLYEEAVRIAPGGKKWVEKAKAEPVPGPAGANDQELAHTYGRGELCNPDCGPLQLIQVVYGARHDEHEVGREFRGFWVAVDAGMHSPWHLERSLAPAHPTMPYLYPPRVYRSEATDSAIRLYDLPAAARHIEFVHFEAAPVCINHLGKGRDKILGALRYGWTKHGTVQRASPDDPDGTGPVEAYAVSELFREIVRFDYEGYTADW
jgi:hypothetical protein